MSTASVSASDGTLASPKRLDAFVYDDKLVRLFAGASILWGIVATLVGTLVSVLLVMPNLTEGIPWLAFGRMRPLHSNAAIYAFVGNVLFAAVYFSTQRLCKTHMWSNRLGYLHFWGWQAIIVASFCTLPLGLTQGRIYAELEWPIDVAIAIVWFAFFGVNFLMTLVRRRERRMYVTLWFYIATLIVIGFMHVLNNLAVPIDFIHSIPLFAGAQDALIDWTYGYNGIGFLLTMPFLGLMYYFLPKAAEQPVFSYKLTIVHFWSLLFIYLWSGPRHLHFTSLPEWVSTLAMLFGLLLWMPSWGGLINGLLTLRSAAPKVAQDPILKFFFVGLIFYGFSVFEGSLLSIKSVNALSNYSDWTVAHIHVIAMGWSGFMAFGMLYWLIPRICRTKLYSQTLMAGHFWVGLFGILLFVLPTYAAGLIQVQMLRASDENGLLLYPDYIESIKPILPLWNIRIVGALLYALGLCMLGVNLVMTWKRQPSAGGKPVQYGPRLGADVVEEIEPRTSRLADAPILELGKKIDVWTHLDWHRSWERSASGFMAMTIVIFVAATVVEVVPMLLIDSNVPSIATVKPYTPLELAGRHLYVSEGCGSCHTQQVRPLLADTKRFGDYSRSGEFVFDRPVQWGNRRIGPDLAREGGKWGSFWHWKHLADPASETEDSVMPRFNHLITTDLKFEAIGPLLKAAKRMGAPYSDDELENYVELARRQAEVINAEIVSQGGPPVVFDKQAIALIAYLQRLGTDISRPAEKQAAVNDNAADAAE